MQTDHCHISSPSSPALIPSASARRAPTGCAPWKTILSVITLLLGMAASQAQSLEVTDGLVLWLNSTDSVAANENGFVTDWADQSPSFNDAAQHDPTLAPLLVPDAINGKPALRFDGVDDYMEIASNASLQPQSGGWSVFFVAKRLGGSKGDYPQIIGSRPWLRPYDKGWAVCFDATGLIGSHYGDELSGHDVTDFKSLTPLSSSSFQLWQVEENLTEGTTTFYLKGDVNNWRKMSMPTTPIDQPDPIYIGREIAGENKRLANMDLAEIMVYNRVLPREERLAVTAYLSAKYGFDVAPNDPPTVSITSPATGTSLAAPGTFTFTATAADNDGIIKQMEFLVDGQPVAIATKPPFSVPVKVFTSGTLTLTAAATDNRGERVVSAPVTITVTGGSASLTVTDGLQLRLDAGEGVQAGGDNLVTAWADQSPNLTDAAQPDTSAAPLLVADGINGKPVIRFDGANSYLEIANSASLQPQSGDWTVLFVAKRNPGSQGDYPQVIGSRPWLAALDKGWSVSYNNLGLVCSHYADDVAGHDLPDARSASSLALDAFQVWQVEENRRAGTTAFYSGGQLNNKIATSAMPAAVIDQADPIRIGRDIGGSNNRKASMDLAEVLIYNRVLSGEERESVNVSLAVKYGLPILVPQNEPPTVGITSPADAATFVVPASLTLTADAADSDGSIAFVQFYRGAALLGAVTNAPYSLEVSNANPGTVVYTAIATDNFGAATRSASVTITNITLNPPVPVNIDPAYGFISAVDYEDTFTVGTEARADGLYNNNSTGGYNIEETHGNPAATWTAITGFSFNSGEGTTCCGYPGNTGNAGAATGVAQSGGGDFSIAYGLRDSYVVELDAIIPADRLDISSIPSAGAALGAPNSLTLFFRLDSKAGAPHPAFPTTGLPGIGLYNGIAETAVVHEDGSAVLTGVNDTQWHHFAVHFDKPHNRLSIFVDRVLRAHVDLVTFADGAYLDYSNGAVGLGAAGGVFWADNFRVGAPGRIARSVDFQETFTVGTATRADGLFNNNTSGGYNLESDPARVWMPFASFSFNSGAGSTCCGYPGNANNAGAATGLAQSGGGDFSFEYGTRKDYVVQIDAIVPGDRFDLNSMPSAGAALGAPNSLTLFFRLDSKAGAPHPAFPTTGLPGIGLYNGVTETAVVHEDGTAVLTGVNDTLWHRFAVHFDQPNKRLLIYIDGQLKADVNLATFAGGIYANYSNAAVGAGGAGGVFWADNFLVGPPEIALPSSIVQLAIELAGADVRISWSGTGVLEYAEDLKGPWTPLPEASSPHVTSPAGTAKFYRVKQ